MRRISSPAISVFCSKDSTPRSARSPINSQARSQPGFIPEIALNLKETRRLNSERLAYKRTLEKEEITIVYNTKSFSFNNDLKNDFVGQVVLMQLTGAVEMNWGADEEETYTVLTIEDAKQIMISYSEKKYLIDKANKDDKKLVSNGSKPINLKPIKLNTI